MAAGSVMPVGACVYLSGFVAFFVIRVLHFFGAGFEPFVCFFFGGELLPT